MRVDLRGGAAAERSRRGLWRDTVGRILRNPPAALGLALVAALIIVAFVGPFLVRYDPLDADLSNRLQTPTFEHLMGTDQQGRDLLIRIVYAARTSLMISVSSIGVAVLVGGFMGALAGGFGGRLEGVLMRTTDVLLAIPGILLAIGIIVWAGRGLLQITVAVAVANSPVFARLLHGSLLRLRHADYVLAARASGSGRVRLLVRHMLPNSMTPIIIQAMLLMGTAVIDVAGLGFLGLGPADPSTAEWGTMLTNATVLTRSAPYLIIFPGLAIVWTVMGFNLLGDGLREALDPRLRR